MRTLRSVPELRAALAESRRGARTIGLVPTMGGFHEGHLALMRRARADCDEVVVSLFVNPAQFDREDDLEGYPREEPRDAMLAAHAGVDYLFAPAVGDVYPEGFATTVSVGELTERLEGAQRGQAHFQGVATVLTKLFNMVAPEVAYFGQKDAQQVLMVKRLVRDLDLAVRIEVCPTVREADGLAMSSRNARLAPSDRARAGALHRALRAAEAAVAAGEGDPARVTARARRELRSRDLEPEYLELVDASTLAPVQSLDGDTLAVVAARVGGVRLIDNQMIRWGSALAEGPEATGHDPLRVSNPNGRP